MYIYIYIYVYIFIYLYTYIIYIYVYIYIYIYVCVVVILRNLKRTTGSKRFRTTHLVSLSRTSQARKRLSERAVCELARGLAYICLCV